MEIVDGPQASYSPQKQHHQHRPQQVMTQEQKQEAEHQLRQIRQMVTQQQQDQHRQRQQPQEATLLRHYLLPSKCRFQVSNPLPPTPMLTPQQQVVSVPQQPTLAPLEPPPLQQPVASSSTSSDENTGMCKVCLTRAISTVLLPCAHVGLCWPCGAKMKVCPFCRQKVDKIVKAYMQ